LSNVEYFCGAYKPVVSIDINSRLFTAGRYTVSTDDVPPTVAVSTERQTQRFFANKARMLSLGDDL
ncbi:unnamed protein product, partial [Allacma fusca]